MKIFRVISEKDGKTTKEPGKTETEIKRTQSFYAAETIELVWKMCEIKIQLGETIIEIAEVSPQITILGGS